jgi:tRNA G18 (ribose-2'-O)-methylase SpoU
VKLDRIADSDDPRLADYRDVRDPRRLREQGIFLAEGRTVVRELLGDARYRVRSLLVTGTALDALGEDLGRLASGTQVFLVERAQLDRVSGVRFHQGCVGAVDAPAELAAASLLGPDVRRVVVLEAVTDPDNVGSIFRNARAFGAQAVFLNPRCASPLYRKAVRTSLGATLRVPFAPLELPDGLAWLRERRFRVLALTPGPDAVDLDDEPAFERTALLLGSEGDGLSPEALAAADVRVRIPMAAGADSVNVATAGAIVMQRIYALST